MKIYLIDFENVKSKGLTGIDSLTEYDRVIIFYSENADTINFEMHQKVLISKAEVEYFKVHVGGKNALDFQLSTLLGYLVSKNYYSHIFVISNDKSFDFLHDFWHGKYIAAPDCIVYRTKTIAQAINYAGGKKQIIVDDDDMDTDTTVFGTQEDTAEAAAAPEAAEPVKEKAVKEEQPAGETKPVQQQAPAETRPDKQEERPAPVKEDKKTEPKQEQKKAANDAKKAEPSNDTEFTISAEELSALEASFGTYSVIKPDSEPKAAPKAADNKPAEKAAPEKQKSEPAPKKAEPAKEVKQTQETKPAAETKPVQEAKPKQVREFYPTLKEALKKAQASAEDINHISQLLINSDTKEEFHNILAKDYKNDGSELYKLLRPKYLRLKEMYAAEHPEYVSPDTITVQAAEEKPITEEVLPAQETAVQEEPKTETKPEQKSEPKTEAAAEPAPEKPAKRGRKPSAKKSAEEKKAAGTKKSSESKAAKTKSAKAEQPSVSTQIAGDRLSQLLDGKCSPDETELIRQLFREVPSRQQLYIRMIKQFGKKSGCVYYNAIKSEYEELRNSIK